jgi:hypothetical protein
MSEGNELFSSAYPRLLGCLKTVSSSFYFSGGEFQVLRIKTAGGGFCIKKHDKK